MESFFAGSTLANQNDFDFELITNERCFSTLSVYNILPNLKDPNAIHEALLYLITQETVKQCPMTWEEILMASILEGGSIKLFMKMLEHDAEYVLSNFVSLFNQVKFFDDSTGVLTEKCMTMLLESPLTTNPRHTKNSKRNALLILQQTGKLDCMRRYIEANEWFDRDNLTVTEISRKWLATKNMAATQGHPRNSIVWRWEQYLDFLQSYLSPDDSNLKITKKMKYLMESLFFVDEVAVSCNPSQYRQLLTWIFVTIMNCLVIHMKTENPDSKFSDINNMVMKNYLERIQQLCPHLVTNDSELRYIYDLLVQDISNFLKERRSSLVLPQLEKKHTHTFQEVAKITSAPPSSSPLLVWKEPVPIESFPCDTALPVTNVLKLQGIRVFRCSVTTLSKIPHYDQMIKMAELDPDNVNTIVGCIHVEDGNQFAVFKDKCLVEVGNFVITVTLTTTC